MVSYQIVVIKSRESNKHFVGKLITSNMVGITCLKKFLMVKKRTGNVGAPFFEKLNEEVRLRGINAFSCTKYPQELEAEEADEVIYRSLLQLIEKYGEENVLNDMIINPEKVKCECGYSVRKQLLDEHKMKYCTYRPSDEDIQFVEALIESKKRDPLKTGSRELFPTYQA
jgi:hypothetical protein